MKFFTLHVNILTDEALAELGPYSSPLGVQLSIPITYRVTKKLYVTVQSRQIKFWVLIKLQPIIFFQNF